MRPRAPRRHPRWPRRSRSRALTAPWPSGPASAEPASASSSDPSLRDLLDSCHPPVESAHHLAHEGIVFRARRRLARGPARLGRPLAQLELDLHLVTKPRAHVRDQLRRLVLRLLVMESITEPQHESRPVHLRLSIEVGSTNGSAQLL